MKYFWQQFKQPLFYFILLFLVMLVATPVFTYAYFARELQDKNALINHNNSGLVLLDRDNKPFFTFNQGHNSKEISLSEIPTSVQNAVIASEDKDFYDHGGFSIRAIIRSAVADLKHQELAFGGSTITQQLVKNALLTQKKSFFRKFQEIVLAQEIERRYSKKEILEMYLNSVYLGEGAFGMEDASETYFNKPASELTLAEGALLAGILPAPSALSPISGDYDKAKSRQSTVLQLMVEQGYIKQGEADAAKGQKLQFSKEKENNNVLAPHYALKVKDELISRYGEEVITRSGYRVKTTLNSDWQRYAEQRVKARVTALNGNDATNGAAVVVDPKSGEILAMVGSYDWYDEKYGKVNMATSPRQPGSSFKPIIYINALQRHLITPATVLEDKPIVFEGGYKPKNYDGKFRGNVLARRALANSLNIPAVEVMEKVGVEQGVEFAKNLGITTLEDPSQYGLSFVLGAANVKLTELTNIYAAFANNGQQYPLTDILEIKDKYNNTVYTYVPEPIQVVDEDAAYLISSILSDNNARSEEFGSSLTLSRTAAVKTGTTEDYRDALTLGYTPSLAVGVWVGNNDNSPMDQVAGSLGAAPIWRDLMEHFLSGTTVEQFEKPSDITTKSICRDKGLLVKEATSSAYMEYFINGTEPTAYCYVSSDTPTPDQSVTPSETPKLTDKPEDTPTSQPSATNTPQPTATAAPTATPIVGVTIKPTLPKG